MEQQIVETWIDITEYAAKYGVSTSTLRRRIRAQTIPFKMERGKYLIKDSPESIAQAPLFSRNANLPAKPRQSVRSNMGSDNSDLHDPVKDFLDSSEVVPVQLRSEYERLQIENRSLKSQVAELETLIKALEAEVKS